MSTKLNTNLIITRCYMGLFIGTDHLNFTFAHLSFRAFQNEMLCNNTTF